MSTRATSRPGGGHPPRDNAPHVVGRRIRHLKTMPRSVGQSDFDVQTDPLPHARLESGEATARTTKWVMTFVWISLALLFLLMLIGPHIPSGE